MSLSVTGTINHSDTTPVTSNCYVRFWLRGCNGGQPRVSGTALIAPDNGPVYFVDLVPNSSGVISGTLYSNDVDIDTVLTPGSHPTWYGVQIYVNGVGGPETPYNLANGTTFNLNSATPLTTTPAVAAPTGDSTYVRIDGGNINVTSTITFVATPVFALPSSPSFMTTFKITLTGNVTSSTLTGAKPGIIIFWIIQDVTGSRTFVWPTNIKNAQSPDPTASSINIQAFIFDGTNAYPVGPMTLN